MNTVPHPKSDMLGDFMKGAMKGIIAGALLMGAMALVFSGLGAIGAATSWFTIAIPDFLMLNSASNIISLGGILLTSGLVNGAMRAYHGASFQHHVEHGNMREAHVSRDTPTLIPLVGMDHGVMADHSMEIDHPHGQRRNWRETTGRSGGDRVQEILRNGSISDKERAAAILAEREARASAPTQGMLP